MQLYKINNKKYLIECQIFLVLVNGGNCMNPKWQ